MYARACLFVHKARIWEIDLFFVVVLFYIIYYVEISVELRECTDSAAV